MTDRIALIVDDQPGIRALLREFMTGLGVTCYEAGDGSRALELLNQICPDVVLLDVKMPGISGTDTLREMRRRQMMMPVIILTAYQDTEVHSSGEEMGLVFRLNKPFDLEDLATLLSSFLRDGDNPPLK